MSGHSRPSSRGKEMLSHSILGPKGQVQNVKAARVYVFGNDDVYEEDEQVEFEMPEIRSRRGQAGSGGWAADSPHEEGDTFFEKEIGEGDTLQSIALKYSCPMSELKRINNLIKDQDFYGLRVLKVPLRRHGYLSELIKQETQHSGKPTGASNFRNGHPRPSESDLPSDACSSDVDFSDPDMQLRVIKTVSIRQNFSRQSREAERFLQKMDKDLSKFRQTTQTDHESLGEVISVLTNKSFLPLRNRKEVVNGVDCGIRWWWCVIAAVTVAILIPTVYFLVYKIYIQKNGS